MGIEYQGVLCVGYTYEQAQEIFDYSGWTDFDDWVEETGMESFSPYFDADREDCIYGLTVASGSSYTAVLLSGSLDTVIDQLTQRLYAVYEEMPATCLMARGW